MIASVARCPGCFVARDGGGELCPHCVERPGVLTALARGTTLGGNRYVLGSPLGEPGGFGITYYAWDKTLERRVAVKEFYPQFLQPIRADGGTVLISGTESGELFGVFLAGFLDEGRRAAAVGHENVVKILDFLQAFGTGYLIMPYYEGETLKAFCQRRGGGPLGWRETLSLTFPIVDALRAVHEVGVIHRDVKPANIYLAESATGRQPILLDFGAARVSGSARTFTTVLTERYAPLEQYQGEATGQGPWTDVYAIAATMLEILTGQLLPSAPSRQLGAALPDLGSAQPGAPRQLNGVLDRALRLDPAERTRNAKLFHDELTQITDGRTAALSLRAPPTVSVKPSAQPNAVRGKDARWMAIAMGLGAIGVTAALLVGWLLLTPASSGLSPTSSTSAGPIVQAAPTTLVDLPTRSAGRSRTPSGTSVAPPKHQSQLSDEARTASVSQHADRDSAEALLLRGDYASAWIRARLARAPDLLKRISDACRGDSLIAARRNETVACPK